MCHFSGPEIGRIKDAAVASFEIDELTELALVYLDIDFDDVIKPGTGNKRTFDFIRHLNNRNIACDFIRAAFKERPKVGAWQDLERLCNTGPAVAVQENGVAQVVGPEATASVAPLQRSIGALESVVRPRLTILDMERWRAREAAVEAQVCRIDIGSVAKGTGFLVGPDLVLTNHHVLTAVIAGQEDAASVRCVFDFKRLGDGTINQGRSVKLVADWLVAHAPPSQAETKDRPDDALPTIDELDFALVRLAEPLGGMPVATAAAGPRGWVKLPTAQPPLTTNAPMIIVQHPNAAPISMALDTSAILGLNANNTRVRYATNTEPGSSGSPCFDFDWSLVALHHMGDPDWRNPRYNEGIPIGLITDRIVQHLPTGI